MERRPGYSDVSRNRSASPISDADIELRLIEVCGVSRALATRLISRQFVRGDYIVEVL